MDTVRQAAAVAGEVMRRAVEEGIGVGAAAEAARRLVSAAVGSRIRERTIEMGRHALGRRLFRRGGYRLFG